MSKAAANTTETKQAAPQRARPTRADEVFGERRRRGETDLSVQKRMHVDEGRLDQKNLAYRWFNDEPGRIATYSPDAGGAHAKDNWMPVSEEEAGGPVQYPVGYHPNGDVKYARLMKKPREWHEQDQAAKIARGQQEERELLVRVPDAQGDGLTEQHGYTRTNLNQVRVGGTRVRGNAAPLAEGDVNDA